MNKLYNFLAVFLVFTIVSCESEEIDPEEAGSMTCTLNGSYWEAISFKNTLKKFTSEPKGKRMDIRAKGMGIEITIGMSLYTENLDNSLPLVTYKTNSEVYGSLVVITDGELIPDILGGGGYGEVHLTAINASEKTMSGTFEFDSSSYNEEEDEYVAIEGVFTDLQFTIE